MRQPPDPYERGIETPFVAGSSSTPKIELLGRVYGSRDPVGSPGRSQRSRLIGQQRTSLEATIDAVFFDWLRVVTDENVAASFDVDPSSFHRHLGKAEAKVLGSGLPGPA